MRTEENKNRANKRILGATIPLPLSLGRDEMNLAEFPFAILQYQRDRKTKTVMFSDTITSKDAQAVERRWTVTGTDA